METKKQVQAYKGFNKDMTCRGFQYPESGEVHVSDDAKLCDHGVHACVAPLDVLKYYPPASSVYHEVEVSGVSGEESDNSKIVGTDVSIGARIDVSGLVKAQCKYVKKHCTNGNNAAPGEPATAGDFGAATAGNCGAATAGESGAATAGESGAATAGNRGAATAGNRGAATAGNFGAATAGNRGAATSFGSVAVGAHGVGTVRGNGIRIKGGMGAFLAAAAECEDSYEVKSYAVGVVDGKKIKADTWYTVKDGEFVEVTRNATT